MDCGEDKAALDMLSRSHMDKRDHTSVGAGQNVAHEVYT